MSVPPLKVGGIDPITFEVLRNGFDAIADEMAYLIVRSARSTRLRTAWTFRPPYAPPTGNSSPRR